MVLVQIIKKNSETKFCVSLLGDKLMETSRLLIDEDISKL